MHTRLSAHLNRPVRRSGLTISCCVLLLGALGGCQITDMPDLGLDRIFGFNPLETAVKPEPRVYPAEAPIGAPVDIEVVRQRDHLLLRNRSAHSYENVQVWLNQGFGHTVESIPIGPGTPLTLTDFVNEHGETYPIAGFMAPERSRPVIAAALFEDGQIHLMSVRLEEDWLIPR